VAPDNGAAGKWCYLADYRNVKELYADVRQWRDARAAPAVLVAGSYVQMPNLGPHPKRQNLETVIQLVQQGRDLGPLEAYVRTGYSARPFRERYFGSYTSRADFGRAWLDELGDACLPVYFDYAQLGQNLLEQHFVAIEGHYFERSNIIKGDET
jgi:hypothetical protein